MTCTDVISALESLDLSTYPIHEIETLVPEFEKVGILSCEIPTATCIDRVRKGTGYTQITDISYPDKAIVEHSGRAHLPHKPVFYGTLSHPNDDDTSNRFIALCECSNLYNKGYNSSGKELFTLSRWEVTEPLNICVIVHDSIYPDINNRFLDEAKSEYKAFIEELQNKKDHFDTFAKYIANKFAAQAHNEYDYLITAQFSDLVLSQDKYDGIMYPSVKAEGLAGMNIAIKPSVVDSKLILAKVAQMTYYKHKGKSLLDIDKYCDLRTWSYSDIKQTKDEEICKYLKINSINDLPIIE